MNRFNFLSWSIVVLAILSGPSEAQNDFQTGLSRADSQLSAVYNQALGRFGPGNQEVLRKAERSWNGFADKEKALVSTLQDENLLPDEFAHAHVVMEISSRANHLSEYFCANTVPSAPPQMLQSADQRLSNAYAECMRRLNPSDQVLLKEAERAWIAYRDADSSSTKSVYNNQSVNIAAAAELTALRTAQLIGIAQSVKQVAPIAPPGQAFPAQNTKPNPEDAKAIGELQLEAKGRLLALLAKKDNPFFKKADALKNIPELPPDVADQISKLDSKFAELSRKWNFSTLIAPASNEYAAVELLAAWSKFTKQLKTGSVDDAGATIKTALSGKPKDVTPDYLPLWQAAEDWQDVYAQDEAAFLDHVKKAQSLAALGKTSDAIKEYQAAYDIIETPFIPQQIKKLRDQSLGL